MVKSETVPQDTHTKFVLVLRLQVNIQFITCRKLELTVKRSAHSSLEEGEGMEGGGGRRGSRLNVVMTLIFYK